MINDSVKGAFVLPWILAASLLLSGCGSTQGAQAPSTVTVTVSRPVSALAPTPKPKPKPKPPAIAQPASLKTFDASRFSVEYSGAWYLETAELDKGGYSDTTIRSSANPNVMARIDITPGAATGDPAVSARKLEGLLREQPGYRRLDFRRMSFNGYPAFRWEFEVEEHGTLLRKVDLFFEDNSGNDFAVLTQAPATSFVLWRQLFAQMRSSLSVKAPPTSTTTTYETATTASPPTITLPVIPAPPQTDFCATHVCIDNFDNGVGTIVQCADGMWSHSGGRPGACSHHGGEIGGDTGDGYGTGGGSSGATEDYGSGNGYTVVCADGTLSDSGGIQGACSHHGGVR